MTRLGPLAGTNVSELVADYRAGRKDPRRVIESVYAHIEAVSAKPAWISLQPLEAALLALEDASQSAIAKPLYGVPFAVKDNIDVAGLPTTAACPEFSYIPSVSATVVERLTSAGAIVIGKTNLDQFATGLVGTRSPYGACASVFDARYISGGSSSGSAVAVARGDVAFALGTDTAGSGRVPALFNRLVGLKPTRGLLSARGVVPACRSLDCVSLFTRELDEAELLLGICAGYDALDPFSRRAEQGAPLPDRPRIGVPTDESLEFFGDTESAQLFGASVDALRGLAVELVPVDLMPFRRVAELLYDGPWVAERLAAIGDFASQHPEAIQPVLRGILEGARRHSALDAFRGSYRLASLRRATEAVWESIDALIVPTAPTHYTLAEIAAEPVRLNQNLGTYTNFVNLLDLSGLAVPSGQRENGLPFGVTYLAPAFQEARLLELARRARGELPRAHEKPVAGQVWLAVAGAHLTGQPLNFELSTLGATRIRTTHTAPEYRLYALATKPPKPGLVYVGDGGSAIEVEVWELSEAAFGHFVNNIPAPLAIGMTRLADGSQVKGFVCEPYASEGARDISEFGGWREFLKQKSAPG